MLNVPVNVVLVLPIVPALTVDAITVPLEVIAATCVAPVTFNDVSVPMVVMFGCDADNIVPLKPDVPTVELPTFTSPALIVPDTDIFVADTLPVISPCTGPIKEGALTELEATIVVALTVTAFMPPPVSRWTKVLAVALTSWVFNTHCGDSIVLKLRPAFIKLKPAKLHANVSFASIA